MASGGLLDPLSAPMRSSISSTPSPYPSSHVALSVSSGQEITARRGTGDAQPRGTRAGVDLEATGAPLAVPVRSLPHSCFLPDLFAFWFLLCAPGSRGTSVACPPGTRLDLASHTDAPLHRMHIAPCSSWTPQEPTLHMVYLVYLETFHYTSG